MTTAVVLKTVRDVWRVFNGVGCVYKPADISVHRLRQMVIANICRDFSELEPSPPRKYVDIIPVKQDGNDTDNLQVRVQENFVDQLAVIGPPVQPDDVRLSWVNYLGRRTSGVTVISVNGGNRYLSKFRESRPLSAYHVKGLFGQATDDHWHDGKLWEKATYDHITQDRLLRLLSSIQASHQRKMFDSCGIDSTSQTAFDLASKGLLRPAINGPTIIYGLKCIHFKPPDFTLEIHCINENEQYLVKLVHDLAITLKTVAVTTQIRCIRHGTFSLDDALLRKHWTVENLIQNMVDCRNLLQTSCSVTPYLSTNSASNS